MQTESAAFETLSPAEAAYFSSGGKDASGLMAEAPSDAPTEPAGGNSSPQTAEVPSGQNAAPEGENQPHEEGDEEIIITGKDGKPRGKDGKFVPHQALHKERERRKATEAELMTVRERQARADERLAVLNEILSQGDSPAPGQRQAQQPAQKIDAATDPLGALEQALEKIRNLESEITNSKTQTQERESARAMQSAYQNDAVRYLQEKPEFRDAYQFLIRQRHAELEAMGVSDARERNEFIANEERGLVAQAFQSRRSPAQMLHNLAIARGFSFTPPQQERELAQQQKIDPVKKIEAIANGQKTAGASLSGAGGTSGEGLTTAALADMSEEEFASVLSKLGKAGMRKLLGG